MYKEVRYSEEELISSIKANNEKALNALYKMHFDMIEHFILANNGTEQEAKDIYQEAIIAFYDKIKEENFELSCKIKTYLYSICRRLWLKKLGEKKRKAGKIEDFENYIEVEEEMPQIEENEKRFSTMGESMKQLGEPCKTILEDYYIHSLSMEEITEKFGYTNSDNAKNQKYKCLQRLKKLFFANYNKGGNYE